MPIVLQLRVHEKDVDMNPKVWYISPIHEKKNYFRKKYNYVTCKEISYYSLV